MTDYAIPTVEEIATLPAVHNALPGAAVPYAIASGEGNRYDLGDRLITVFARPEDTGGEFAAAWVLGKKGTSAPFTSTQDSTFVQIFDGQVRVWLPTETQTLVAGDSVSIPAGVPWAWRMEAHINRFLHYSTSGATVGFAEEIGSTTQAHVFANQPRNSPHASVRAEAAEKWGVTLHDDLELRDLAAVSGENVPHGVEPFVIKAGAGDRYTGMAQMNSYLTRNRNTDEKFFAISTRTGPAPFFPRHFHRQHTENFLCVDGRVRLHVNGEDILLTRGDFVHAPAGTIHTFQIEAQNTQLLGLLTPGMFEPFFEYMNAPTENRMQTEGPVEFPFDGFARAQQDLDLVVVGPPPGSHT